MVDEETTDLRVFPDLDRLSAAAARAVAATLTTAARKRGRSSIALSGGRTPRALYERLAQFHRDDIPWSRVHVFWGDERYVSLDDEHSNYRMARETLLDHVAVQADHVHGMPTECSDPRDAAAAYERVLKTHFVTGRRFDLILLGVGDDGHTASLFPGSPALDETERWVVAVSAPVAPPARLTLTLPTLIRARTIYVIVSGSAKAAPLQQALSGPPDPQRCPASAVRRTKGRLTWWADAAAAALVGSGCSRDGDRP